jgi:hypothetical protein
MLLNITHNVAFTSQQMGKLSALLDSASPPAPNSAPPTKGGNAAAFDHRSVISLVPVPIKERENIKAPTPQVESRLGQQSLGALAKEFGIEAHLVEALAQRLSAMC